MNGTLRHLSLLLSLSLGACVSTVTEGDGGASGATTAGASGTTVAGTSGTPSTSGAVAGTTGATATTVGATTAGATASGAGTTTGSTGSTSSSGSTGSTTGSVSGCGDGIVEAGEVCDLGANNGKGLGCNITCNLFGLVTTLAGSVNPGQADGFGAAAQLGRPYGLAVMGDFLYVADTSFKAIRAVELTNNAYVQTIAGGHLAANDLCIDGDGASTDPDAGFCDPTALIPFDGGLLVSDYGALRLLRFSPTLDGGMLSTFGGTAAIGGTPVPGFDAGVLGSCLYGAPSGMALVWPNLYTNTQISGVIGVTDFADNPIDLELAASLQGGLELGGMTALNGLVYTTNTANPGALYAYDPATEMLDVPGDGGFSLNPGSLNTLLSPDGVCTDGQSIYICETEGGEEGGAAGDILQYVPATGSLTLLAGGHPFPNGGASAQPDGLGADAGFFDPAGCIWDPTRKVLYVSDRSGNEIRMIQ